MPGPTTTSRVLIDRTLRGAGLDRSLKIVIESFNAGTIVRYVEVGLGIAVVSISPALRRQLQTSSRMHPILAIRDISSMFDSESLIIAHRRGRMLLPHAKSFRQMVLKVLAPVPMPRKKHR